MPGVVCSPPTGTSAPADAAVPSSLGTADTSGEVTSWRTSPQGGIAPPSPDSESGIEDSPDSIDGVAMPLSPPIPIPSFRRGSLQLGRGHTPPPGALLQPDHLSNSAPATASEDNTPPSTRGTPSPPPPVSGEPQCGGEAGAGVPTIEISEVLYLTSLDSEALCLHECHPQ